MPEQPQMPQGQEVPPSPDKTKEKRVEQPAPAEVKKDPKPKTAAPLPKIPTNQNAAQAVPPRESQKSETLERIEDIMEEDLGAMYENLPEDRKQQFREKGEETAKEIEGMMYKVKVKSKKVFKLMFSWLKIIPGVSKYFLEQEAKLKTDELMDLKEEIDKQRTNQV